MLVSTKARRKIRWLDVIDVRRFGYPTCAKSEPPMFPMIMLRGAVALSVVTALSGDQSITPMAASDCRAIANTLSQAVAIPLTTKEGKPDFPSGLRGNACLMSGRAIGLQVEFDAVRKKLNAALAGWTPVPDYDADGPASTITGFGKASQRIVYALETVPPRGTCQNVPLADCKVPRQRWTWTLKVVGFSQ
jgi:hypothetical protein